MKNQTTVNNYEKLGVKMQNLAKNLTYIDGIDRS